jgi:probable HAF family extracellular repeat protein
MKYRKFVAAISGLFLIAPAQAAAQYHIQDLGTADRTMVAVSINNLGQVVISTAPEEPVDLPFLLGEAIVIDENGRNSLGSLGGSRVVAAAMNNLGQVVGHADSAVGSSDAFIYTSGQLTSLNLAAVGATGSIATGINDRGDIVGQAHYRGVSRAFVLSSIGVFEPLHTLGGNHAAAHDINESGIVVGASRTASDTFYLAFMFDQNQVSNLGTLGGLSSSANAINDHSIIVGSSTTVNNVQHAALFVPGSTPIDLAPTWAQSGAGDVNNRGQIVGFVTNTPDQDLKAALFSASHPPMLLQELIPVDSGWTSLYAAAGINDRGQIVGTGVFNGEPGIRAFLMTPIPEPTSIGLLVLSGVFFVSFFTRHLRSRFARC